MIFHMAAFLAGYLLDLLFGDPHWLPHPVKLMGKLIAALEKKWNTKDAETARRRGVLLVVTVILATLVVSSAILTGAYLINRYAGAVVEAILTYTVLAAKSLRTESMKVYKELAKGDLPAARKAVSMIVGRDTDALDEAGVSRAAVETVAENTSDGVIAPLIYTAIGGPVLGLIYKAINTMDSMVGYKNERYINFGRAAAKLDDIVNFVPARISAAVMIAAAYMLGGDYSGRDAARIFRRDRYNHASPNSAQTESVCAGALRIRLAGDASYFGKIVKKPFIGDDIRPIEFEDIKRANKLMYMTELLCMIAALIIMAAIFFIRRGLM